MAKEALAKYKEQFTEEIKESIALLPISIDFEKMLSEENSDTSLKAELEKPLRDTPKEISQPILKKAEFVDRADDIETNSPQKKAAIDFFGEQGQEEIIPVLEELKEEEKSKKNKKADGTIIAINKAIDKIIVRVRNPNFTELELQGNFRAERRPWRAMFRVTQIENEILHVVLPGWNPKQKVLVSKNIFPKNLHQFISPGQRFFAKINIGAEEQFELYFTEFEDKS